MSDDNYCCVIYGLWATIVAFYDECKWSLLRKKIFAAIFALIYFFVSLALKFFLAKLPAGLEADYTLVTVLMSGSILLIYNSNLGKFASLVNHQIYSQSFVTTLSRIVKICFDGIVFKNNQFAINIKDGNGIAEMASRLKELETHALRENFLDPDIQSVCFGLIDCLSRTTGEYQRKQRLEKIKDPIRSALCTALNNVATLESIDKRLFDILLQETVKHYGKEDYKQVPNLIHQLEDGRTKQHKSVHNIKSPSCANQQESPKEVLVLLNNLGICVSDNRIFPYRNERTGSHNFYEWCTLQHPIIKVIPNE